MRLESAFVVLLSGLMVGVAGRLGRPEGARRGAALDWLPVLLALAALLAVVSGILGHPPLDEDDWYYLGAARWLHEHPQLGSLFTQYAMPREPIFRPVTLLWFWLGYATLGTHWWAWHLVSAALQVLIAWRAARLAAVLGATPQAARLAAALVLVHPALVECVVWINAQETQLLVLACVLGVEAGVRGRWGLSAVAAVLAVHLKEQGATLPALIVLGRALGLCSPPAAVGVCSPPPAGGWDASSLLRRAAATVGWPGVAAACVVLASLLYRRLVLVEPHNLEHLAYLEQFLQVPLAARAAGLATVASNLALPTVDGLGPAGLPWVVAAFVALPLGLGAAGLSRRGVLLGLAAASAWALFATLPALADIARPSLTAPPGVTPDPNLRHLALALVGPALFAGVVLASARWRWAGSVAVAAAAALFIVNTTPYERVGQRLVAGLEVLSRPLGADVAVRFVEPRDTLAAALAYGPWADPALPRLPVLVGEPRCGCARPPLPPVDGVRLRAFSDAFYSAHDSALGDLSPGGRCACQRWRPDARFVRLDGPEAGPFRLVYER